MAVGRVTPAPPIVGGGVPGLGPIRPFLANPTAFLRAQRERLGDTFLLRVAGFDLFCVFGPVGLRSLYALPEDEASFGQATRTLLGLKLPPSNGDPAALHLRPAHGLYFAFRHLLGLEQPIGEVPLRIDDYAIVGWATPQAGPDVHRYRNVSVRVPGARAPSPPRS